MRYSVFDKSCGTYSVFEGPQTQAPIRFGKSSLGASPSDTTSVLPPDSRYLGESDMAVGQIVDRSYRLIDFIISFSTVVAAAVFSRWIYDRFIKE